MTLKSREITSSTAFRRALSNLWLGFKMRDIFTFVRRSGLLSVRQSKVTHTYIFIYLSLRAKQEQKRDHTGWNVGETGFSLKCVFKTLLGRVGSKIIYFASEPLLSMVEEAGLNMVQRQSTIKPHFLLVISFPSLKDRCGYFKVYLKSVCTCVHMYVGRVMSCHPSPLQWL